MPHLLPALNEHIRRLARREVRTQTLRTKRAASHHRRDIAALKRLVKALASRLVFIEKRTASRGTALTPAAGADNLRFRADGLRTHRSKLGLSAKDYGKLVGVSGLTIYHWEGGKAKPRRRQLASLSQIRGIGKREALKRLVNV